MVIKESQQKNNVIVVKLIFFLDMLSLLKGCIPINPFGAIALENFR